MLYPEIDEFNSVLTYYIAIRLILKNDKRGVPRHLLNVKENTEKES